MDTSDGVVEVQEEQPDEHMVPPEPDVDATRADDDDEGGVDDAGIAWKKERVAVIFGYIGARFQGLQRNPGAFTVEDELEGAIYRAGGISSKRNAIKCLRACVSVCRAPYCVLPSVV